MDTVKLPRDERNWKVILETGDVVVYEEVLEEPTNSVTSSSFGYDWDTDY